jgi:hypothetical protein
MAAAIITGIDSSYIDMTASCACLQRLGACAALFAPTQAPK